MVLRSLKTSGHKFLFHKWARVIFIGKATSCHKYWFRQAWHFTELIPHERLTSLSCLKLYSHLDVIDETDADNTTLWPICWRTSCKTAKLKTNAWKGAAEVRDLLQEFFFMLWWRKAVRPLISLESTTAADMLSVVLCWRSPPVGCSRQAASRHPSRAPCGRVSKHSKNSNPPQEGAPRRNRQGNTIAL